MALKKCKCNNCEEEGRVHAGEDIIERVDGRNARWEAAVGRFPTNEQRLRFDRWLNEVGRIRPGYYRENSIVNSLFVGEGFRETENSLFFVFND